MRNKTNFQNFHICICLTASSCSFPDFCWNDVCELYFWKFPEFLVWGWFPDPVPYWLYAMAVPTTEEVAAIPALTFPYGILRIERASSQNYSKCKVILTLEKFVEKNIFKNFPVYVVLIQIQNSISSSGFFFRFWELLDVDPCVE